MTNNILSQESDTSAGEKQWRGLFRLGGYATILVLMGTVADMIIGSMLGGNITTIPQTAIDRFLQFQNNWLLGLYNLDLLNAATTIIMVPAFVALVAAHSRSNPAWAVLALAVFLVGTAVFITNNTALPMLELSSKYTAASPTQQPLLAAAGEAMLARGAHGSLGTFMGFTLLLLAEILISLVMLTGRVFGKATSVLGILGCTCLLIYTICVTFLPETRKVAMMVTAPGGLMTMAWMVMFTMKLFKLGKEG